MGRPVITSNFQILRDSFNKGAVFVDATSGDIRRGIKKMIGEHLQYKCEVQILRDEKLERWKEVLIGLRKTIGESDGGMCR